MQREKSICNRQTQPFCKQILAAVKSYYWLQWKNPTRLLFKGFGFTIWKWSGVFIPCWNIWVGKIGHFGYDIFHNGVGFSIHFPPVIIVDLCVSGKIGWWFKKGIIRIQIHKWEWSY